MLIGGSVRADFCRARAATKKHVSPKDDARPLRVDSRTGLRPASGLAFVSAQTEGDAHRECATSAETPFLEQRADALAWHGRDVSDAVEVQMAPGSTTDA